ncbi:hypothetical protein AB0K12_45770 [Nonomuraea sp. NPDC049419]|uniref:hypothetical protein n=1 Tax=Nonomuraea sp. NPDC049419 TaxID=3155772 RepID=UPI0034463D0A
MTIRPGHEKLRLMAQGAQDGGCSQKCVANETLADETPFELTVVEAYRPKVLGHEDGGWFGHRSGDILPSLSGRQSPFNKDDSYGIAMIARFSGERPSGHNIHISYPSERESSG